MSGTKSLTLEGAGGAETGSTVELRVPADGAYASVLRTLAAGLGARLDFTMDDIEDLRVVVSEAAALVLEQADPGADLTATFDLGLAPDRVEVSVATDAASPAPADYENFGWQVLAVLTTDAGIDSTPGRYRVWATVTSSLAAEPSEASASAPAEG
ncbi:anti-sigma factor [Nocardioides sp. GY 10113]|uniref:ATP-binding protein n=1 Tax=Nocardioides sp. GY 10113 TaxID=2569761 RepID=UPI0010A844D7|nr:anti-sigma factor [Nocardioides sp. GY 10113]TIC88801.1 anti-sigma factor [Nocardioides sp. GY 10113]